MDSFIYKYVLDELKSSEAKGPNLVPLHLLKAPLTISMEAFQNLKMFLSEIILPNAPSSPLLINLENNNFSLICLKTHEAFIEIINGSSPEDHPFRSNGIQLLKFLSFCSLRGVPKYFCETDYTSYAMMCFLLEGLMFCGWCPDSYEGVAKRSAHEYCGAVKKSFHRTENSTSDAFLGYIWGAWLFAQKTEGVRVVQGDSSVSSKTFEWHIENTQISYIVETIPKTPLFYILPKINGRISHPFTDPLKDGLKQGLSIFIENESVYPLKLVEYSEINRIKKHGHKFNYQCATDTISGIAWTVVILVFGNTFYRMDLLKLPEHIKGFLVHADLRIETKAKLEKKEKVYSGIGAENTFVEFIDNPLELELNEDAQEGFAHFSSMQKHSTSANPLSMVTAWVHGKAVTGINRTHLLGIYD